MAPGPRSGALRLRERAGRALGGLPEETVSKMRLDKAAVPYGVK